MADFTALKTAIQNAIKQNGNEEITGNLLQEVLLAIVTTLGDGSINDLISALDSETTTRSQADGTLQQNIDAEAQARQLGDSTLQSGINNERDLRIAADNALGTRIDNEATARGNADTALQNAINTINTKLAEGYVYVGIATATTNPGTPTGKVFYIAIAAGTYTNFGNAVVTAGLNVIKYNGSVWSVDQVIAIDAEPTQGSANLVKSGGVLNSIIQNGPAFDLSAYNAQGGVLATYADLSAAITALNALPADFKKGGMSFKFVLTSDNNYVQYRLLASSFSTTVTDWVNESLLIEKYIGDIRKISIDQENIQWERGKYYNSFGEVMQHGAFEIAEVLLSNAFYVKTNCLCEAAAYSMFVDNEDNIVGNVFHLDGSDNQIFEVPVGATKIKISNQWAVVSNEKISLVVDISSYLSNLSNSNKKTFINRNVNWVGTSIWWYNGRTHPFDGKIVGYQDLLRQQFDFLSDSEESYCYSGFSLGYGEDTTKSIAEMKLSTFSGSAGDIWTLDTVTNDWGNNVPLGTIADYENNTGNSTYYGALRSFKDKIVELSGQTAIVVVSNAITRRVDADTPNSVNLTMRDYENALLYVAYKNGWYFIDQYDCGINTNNIYYLTLVGSAESSTGDGLHPNNLGFKIAVKPWIEQFNILSKLV